MSPQRDWLSVKDVAIRLDVHEQTVRALIRARRLTAIRVGKLVRVGVADLAEFCRRNDYRGACQPRR